MNQTLLLPALLISLAWPLVALADDTPTFRDVAAEAGVAVAHRTRTFDNPYADIMQGYTALGASASVADVDGDGLEDVFVTDSSVDGKNLLWRNVSGEVAGAEGLRFVDVAEEARVANGNDATNASANSLFFDMEGDGDPDLLVIRFGQNQLFENLAERFKPGSGEIRFRDVTATSGMIRYLNCIAAIAFDYDLDGDLDLFLANYFAPVNLFDPETPRFFPESFEEAENGGGVTLFRNEGLVDGRVRFRDATAEAGLDAFSGWALDLGHADIDHDGDDDLYVAADFGTDRLYVNGGFDRFVDVTENVLGVDTKKGMNVDWADFDGDGRFDVYVTNITDEYMNEGNFLWQNLTPEGAEPENVAFADVARETGTHNTGWGWAGKFFDYDNDGLLDLYVVNGWVSGSDENYVLDVFELITSPDVDLADARNWPPMGEKTLSGYQRNALFHNVGGLFVDQASRHGVDSLVDGRGVSVADFDRDGRQDLFVTNSGAAPFLFQNVMPRREDGAPHWLQLRLEGARREGMQSNRDAVGARVRVTQRSGTEDMRKLSSFINGGNGFAGQSSRIVHFGLGDDDGPVSIEVRWPSGAVQTLDGVAVDQLYDVKEGLEAQPGQQTSSGRRPSGPQPPRPGSAQPQGPSPPSPGKGVDVPASELPTPELSAERHLELARGARSRGDLDSALHHYELALTAEPGQLRWGAEHRQAAIDAEEYRRSLGFWKGLAKAYPDDPVVILNLGFAHVDKIPSEGAVTQVILANKANQQLGRAIELMGSPNGASQADDGDRSLGELERLWLAYYSRGNSYMYWPAIFGRTQAGIDDLERALELAERIETMEGPADGDATPTFRGRAWAALGDGYWRLQEHNTMREVWQRGLQRYPDSVDLRQRLELEGDELGVYLEEVYDPRTRVATHLREIWQWHDAR